MVALSAALPRFVVQIEPEPQPWVSGADTTRDFAELRALLDADYEVVTRGGGYAIYERRTGSR
jgi:hypothetical protein